MRFGLQAVAILLSAPALRGHEICLLFFLTCLDSARDKLDALWAHILSIWDRSVDFLCRVCATHARVRRGLNYISWGVGALIRIFPQTTFFICLQTLTVLFKANHRKVLLSFSSHVDLNALSRHLCLCLAYCESLWLLLRHLVRCEVGILGNKAVLRMLFVYTIWDW